MGAAARRATGAASLVAGWRRGDECRRDVHAASPFMLLSWIAKLPEVRAAGKGAALAVRTLRHFGHRTRQSSRAVRRRPITSRKAAMMRARTCWRLARLGNCRARMRPSGLRKMKAMTARTTTIWDKVEVPFRSSPHGRSAARALGPGPNGLPSRHFWSALSTSPPCFFHSPKPPAIWATGCKPISCAVRAASAERQPPPQKKTKRLSCAKIGLA